MDLAGPVVDVRAESQKVWSPVVLSNGRHGHAQDAKLGRNSTVRWHQRNVDSENIYNLPYQYTAAPSTGAGPCVPSLDPGFEYTLHRHSE